MQQKHTPEADAARARHDELAARFDADPDAIEWARAKVERAVERAEAFRKHASDTGNLSASTRWRFTAGFMRQTLLGGEGCVVAAFDTRLPQWVRALKDRKAAGS